MRGACKSSLGSSPKSRALTTPRVFQARACILHRAGCAGRQSPMLRHGRSLTLASVPGVSGQSSSPSSSRCSARPPRAGRSGVSSQSSPGHTGASRFLRRCCSFSCAWSEQYASRVSSWRRQPAEQAQARWKLRRQPRAWHPMAAPLSRHAEHLMRLARRTASGRPSNTAPLPSVTSGHHRAHSAWTHAWVIALVLTSRSGPRESRAFLPSVGRS
mmetsp:Transcript_28758/g.68623  ORF Transcript_28758/g.68623 Transcript_28758/m.68623 type:complete len:215 (-) Transcript_28758:184-828(-)